MDMLFISLTLAVLGMVFGSFAGAQVWRLRAQQLKVDKKAGEKVSETEYKRLAPLLRPVKRDRSECLHCHHELHWYDMIPVVSWLTLAGRCRYCRHNIGWLEPLIEIGVSALFVLSYLYWPFALNTPLEWIRFAVWLVACVLMAILFVYDAKWSLLPFAINIGLVITGAVFLALSAIITPFTPADWWSLLGSISILSGLYYLFSIPGWVGLGDAILGLGLAMLLTRWDQAFLVLFLANLLGCLALIPLVLKRTLTRGAQIPFGPFLMLATVVALLWGPTIISAVFDWSGVLINPLMI